MSKPQDYGTQDSFIQQEVGRLMLGRTFTEAVLELDRKALEIMLAKRRLRGTRNIEEQGLAGIITRLGKDKLARVERAIKDRQLRDALIERNMPVAEIDKYVPNREETGESLRDDLLDIANYAKIAVLLLDGDWKLPE